VKGVLKAKILDAKYEPSVRRGWIFSGTTHLVYFWSYSLQLHLPMHTALPGHELTTEPFRWDQRLFSIILRMPGTRSSMPGKMGVHSNDPAIAAMCEVTGGNVCF